MKTLILKRIALFAILISTGEALAAIQPRGLVLYTRPPADYVLNLEFVTLTHTSVAYTTVLLPTGKKEEISRGGIVAVINYPPEVLTEALPQDAAIATRAIKNARSKYPQFSAKLDAALSKWTNSLEVFRQRQKLNKITTPQPATTLNLNVDGVAYSQVVLMSFDGATVGIAHSSGVARIPAIKLTTEQIASLNATSPSVRIAADKIAASVQRPASSSGPVESGATSPKEIPASWTAETSETARLAASAKRCFPSASDEKEALRKAIQQIPGIETKEPGIADLILNDLAHARSYHGIEDRRFWILYSEALRKWTEARIPGDCPYFLSKEFLTAIVSTKVQSELTGATLNWNGDDSTKMIVRHFGELVWAARRPEVRPVAALGALIAQRPWEEVKALRLADGSVFGDRLEALRKEVATEHCVAIQFMTEGILAKVPPGSPYAASEVMRKASVLTGPDIENAYNVGLLDELASLHGRSFRFALAGRIAGLIRQSRQEVPTELHDPYFVRTVLDDFTSLDAIQNFNEVMAVLPKHLRGLSENTVVRATTLFVSSARTAVKEGVKETPR